ncbi:MAG TPA: SigE family RNA polymerase sigma factor [Rugosimonospora sp.]|nr:SigE family RNA polymerase sigma factor [Rugosimonospora sp.]
MHEDHERDFQEFVQVRMQSLRNLAYFACGDWQAAEDAVSRSLAKLYVRWPKLTAPESYAKTMVVRAAIDEKRRPWRRERPAGDAMPDVVGVDPSQAVDERARVRDALLHLPKRQRAVLVLRFYEELSVEQAAELMGCRESTVRSQTSRGLATLRGLLAQEDIELKEHLEDGDEGYERHHVRGPGRAGHADGQRTAAVAYER